MRINVSGWLDSDDLDPEDVDLDDRTGLSQIGFEKLSEEFLLTDLTIEAQR